MRGIDVIAMPRAGLNRNAALESRESKRTQRTQLINRAAIAPTPETSDYTGAKDRLEETYGDTRKTEFLLKKICLKFGI